MSPRTPNGAVLSPRARTTLRAYARAQAPGGPRGLPPAETAGGVPIVAAVEQYLAHTPSRVRRGVALALTALEWSSFPRRFSRLTPDAAGAHLSRLERSRLAPRRDLLLALKVVCSTIWTTDERTQAALEIDARCTVAGPAPAPDAPPLDREDLVAPEGVERCDVVIVGSGAGGAAAARVLAERGLAVIVVEAGDLYDAASYPQDPMRATTAMYRDGGLTFAEGLPVVGVPVGRCVGGTTVVNSGTCFRTPDDVLATWRAEHGIGWAPDLHDEFEAVERDLRVRPVDPATAGRNAELCRVGAERLGAHNGPIARNAGRVTCCATCPTGCELDAKQAAHVGELPRAVAAGARVRANARVERVIVEGGRAVGIVARTRPAGAYEVRARAVVLAAGALGTPELLLDQGLGNASGAVGRHLRVHPACWVGALHDEPVNGWDGIMQSWYVDEWANRGLVLEATFTPLGFGAQWLPGVGREWMERVAAYDRLAVIGVQLADRSEGRVTRRNGRSRLTYRLTRDDARRLRFGIGRAAAVHVASGAREIYPQLGGLRTLPARDAVARIEGSRPGRADLRLEGFHPMGTTRMGADPATSVVDPTGAVHDVPGLHVVDASIFPTALRVNPMITIAACSRRIARGLADRLEAPGAPDAHGDAPIGARATSVS
jgi:choline dehydrogenase-like flavoprotein